MNHNESFSLFKRKLDSNFNEFVEHLDQLQVAFASTNVDVRLASAKQMQKSAHTLFDCLAAPDRPKWIRVFVQSADAYVAKNGEKEADRLLTAIVQHRRAVVPIVLDSNAAASHKFGFDEIFNRVKQEERLPELFDAHIDSISQIIDSGAIQIVSVLDALKTLVQILKANRDGSHVAVTSASYMARYIHNVIGIGLRKIKGVEILVEAYGKTEKELGDGIQRIDASISDALEETFEQEVPRFNDGVKLLETQAKALSAPDEDSLDDGIIDGEFINVHDPV